MTNECDTLRNELTTVQAKLAALKNMFWAGHTGYDAFGLPKGSESSKNARVLARAERTLEAKLAKM